MDSMHLRQLKLERRLEGLQREKAIYQYALDNVGKKVMKTRLMKQFGLSVYESDAENFERTRLCKYVVVTPYMTKQKNGVGNYVTKYKRYIKDLIWLPKHLIVEHRIITIATIARWGYRLCYKETVPFWLLKEYRGPYTGREFITEMEKRIKKTINQLSAIPDHD